MPFKGPARGQTCQKWHAFVSYFAVTPVYSAPSTYYYPRTLKMYLLCHRFACARLL